MPLFSWNLANLANRPGLHLLLALVVSGLWLIKPVLLRPTEYPGGDAPRYIAVGLNLYEHGVISSIYQPGHPPAPGLVVGGPLIAIELAAMMAMNLPTYESFRCTQSHPGDNGSCAVRLTGLKVAHWLELIVFAASVWLVGWMVFRQFNAAWAAMVLALLCREITADTAQALTEPLGYASIGLLLLAWIAAWQRRGAVWWLLCGTALGFSVLIKPAAAIVLPLAGILMLGSVWRKKWRLPEAIRSGAALAFGCGIVLAPWLLRNLVSLHVLALSDPAYLATTFAHRLAYNTMTWPEWAVGWLFYLPDFGDNLARAWFAAPLWDRLGWEAQSYYIYGRDILYSEAVGIAPQPGTAAYLLHTYVLTDPLKHLAVTALLAWRGVFVGKLWGLLALALLPIGLARTTAPIRAQLWLLLLPGALLLFAQAALSVSIPRYNGMLVLPLALAATGLLLPLPSIAARLIRKSYLEKANRRDRP